jgi:hypothetical protein
MVAYTSQHRVDDDGYTLVRVVSGAESDLAADTGTRTSVGDAATSGTLLAANTNRKGASFRNTSTAILYLALGATAATSTDHTVALNQGDVYELPLISGGRVYTGIVVGIWASDAGGSCLVTEIT